MLIINNLAAVCPWMLIINFDGHLLHIVAVVDWDSGGGKVGTVWDGAPHSSTVEQLTSLSRRALGENGVDPLAITPKFVVNVLFFSLQ